MAGITGNEKEAPKSAPRKRRFRPVTLDGAGPAPSPGWLRGLADPSPATAGFRAGGALFLLDQWIRTTPACLGVLSMRQALAATRVMGARLRLRADEAELRDAHHLTRNADDPGPAGRLYRGWRRFASTPTHAGSGIIGDMAADLNVGEWAFRDGSAIKPDPRIVNPLQFAAEKARHAVFGLAEIKARQAETLAYMSADLALASALGWAKPLPLLATALDDPSLKRRFGGVWPQPVDEAWGAFVAEAIGHAALAALDRAAAISRRADALAAAASTVRSEGKAAAVSKLLADDAIVVADLIGGRGGLGSDRAARRFIDHMVELGALKLLTERPHLRLYGI